MADIDISLPETRQGVSTSEFSATTVTTVIQAVIAIVALVHPGFKVDETTQQLIVSIAMVSLATVTAVYSRGRSQVKQATINAQADVKAAAVVAGTPVVGLHFDEPPTIPGPPVPVGE